MKKKAYLSSIAVAALLIAGCGKREEPTTEKPYSATKGDVSITIIESGTVDAIKMVEIKPQVTGRVVKLMVDEGSTVKSGDLIATIDPKPTELQLEQNEAQLMGARSQVERTTLEIMQRRKTAKAAVDQAQARVNQLTVELRNAPALLRSELETAQAALASAIQDRDRFITNSQPTQRVAAKSALDEAKQNLSNASTELQRQKDLEAKGYVATRAVQSAELTVELAKARLANAQETYNRIDAGFSAESNRAEEAIKTAQAGLNRAKTNQYTLEIKRQDLASAKAALANAQAGLADPSILEKQRIQSSASAAQIQSVIRETQRLLRETEVRTPISGIVTKRLLQVGENATGLGQFGSGSTIVKIEDRTQMRVKLAVNEIDVARLKIGMKAEVAVDAIVGKTLTGTITKIAPAKQAVEGATQLVGTDTVVKYEVEIILDQVDEELKSGMSAKCTMRVSEAKNTVFLPAEYVEKKDNEYYVYAPAANPKDPKSKPEKRKVKAGLVSSSRIQILDGVKEGDKFVKPPFTGPDRKGFMQMGPDNADEEAPKEGEKK